MGTFLAGLLGSLNLKLVTEIAIGVTLGNAASGLLSFILQLMMIALSER